MAEPRFGVVMEEMVHPLWDPQPTGTSGRVVSPPAHGRDGPGKSAKGPSLRHRSGSRAWCSPGHLLS